MDLSSYPNKTYITVKIIKHYTQKGAVSGLLLTIAAIVVITLIIIWLLLLTKPQPQAKLVAPVPVQVVTVLVESRAIHPFEDVTGRLQPVKTAQIRFEVAGQVRIRSVEPGKKVAAETLLLQLQDEDYRDQLLQAEAELLIEQKGAARDKDLLDYARTNLQLQQQEEARLQSLVEKNLIAQSQLDTTRQRVFDLQAEVARLEFSVSTASARIRTKQSRRDIAKRNLSRTSLRAPFAGIVNEVMLEEGDYVNVNQAAVSVVDTSEYDLQLDVRGELLASLKLNQAIMVQVKQKSFQGVVVALQPDPDVNTNTHQIRVRIAGDELQAGALAVATIPITAQAEAMVIPVSAVLNLRGKEYVFSLQDDRLKKIAVKLGRRLQNEYVVLSGLVPGQKIIARDVTSLSDEQVVTFE